MTPIPKPAKTKIDEVLQSRADRRRRVSALIPGSLLTLHGPPPSKEAKRPRPPLMAAKQIKLRAAEARAAEVKNAYKYPVIVVWRGKYFPVFPGSAQGGRVTNGRLTAAKLNEPLLSTSEWAKKPVWEMYESIKEVLSAGWGYNNVKDEYVVNIWGYHEETTVSTTLEEICEKYFSKQEDGSKRRGPLVLGFRPYEWVSKD